MKKFLLGMVVAILVGGGLAAGYYKFTQLKDGSCHVVNGNVIRIKKKGKYTYFIKSVRGRWLGIFSSKNPKMVSVLRSNEVECNVVFK